MLIAAPMATSSMRTRPTCQPAGEMRLKMTIRVMVKAAWLAMNPTAVAAYAARKTATGSVAHMMVG